MGIEIHHCTSMFLNGLLFLPPDPRAQPSEGRRRPDQPRAPSDR